MISSIPPLASPVTENLVHHPLLPCPEIGLSPNLNRVLDNNPGPNGASGLISQDSFLERNLQAKEVENLRIIDESEESSVVEKNVDENHELETEVSNSVKMDETNYQAKKEALKKIYRRVQVKIKSYTVENVRIVDKEEYKEHLSKFLALRYVESAFLEAVEVSFGY